MAEQDFSYSIVSMPEDRFFWITFRGELSFGEMTRAHRDFLAHPDYAEGVDELLDFTETSLREMSSEDVLRVRDYVLGSATSAPGRNVLVVNTDLEYGLGRMIAAHLDKDVPDQRQIAFSIRDALEWLRPGRSTQLIAAYRGRAQSGTD